jgi:hypothetical protein
MQSLHEARHGEAAALGARGCRQRVVVRQAGSGGVFAPSVSRARRLDARDVRGRGNVGGVDGLELGHVGHDAAHLAREALLLLGVEGQLGELGDVTKAREIVVLGRALA